MVRRAEAIMEAIFKKLLGIEKRMMIVKIERHNLIASVVGEGYDLYPYNSHEAVEYSIFKRKYKEWKQNK